MTLCKVSKGMNLQQHCCENIKSYNLLCEIKVSHSSDDEDCCSSACETMLPGKVYQCSEKSGAFVIMTDE
jgi:hypothetical protein